MKGYESYKTSKIEGIKEVPSHWKPIKLKFIGNLYSGLTGKSGNDFYNEDNPLSRPYINFKNIANNVRINPKQFDLVEIKPNEEQNQVKKGDLFFLMSSENFDDIAKTAVLVDDLNETYLNSFCRGFRIQDENFVPEFLNYLLLSGHYREILSNEAKGFTRINIQVGKINNFPIYAPFNKEEQTTIASFLDYKTNLIDATIEKKKRLIALLKEKRQAVINEAVTKGLNPNAPMKNSGVEWLGEIPEHWTSLPFRRICSLQQGLQIPINDRFYEEIENSYEYITTKSIHNPNDFRQYILNPTTSVICNENDVLMGRTGNTGEVVTNVKGVFHNNFFKIDFDRNKFDKDFFVNYLNFTSLQKTILLVAGTTTIPDINHGAFLELSIPLPPINEQVAIVNFINEKTAIVDSLLIKNKDLIEKLQTYRQSLISEAVTGKIDVRDWQSSTKNR